MSDAMKFGDGRPVYVVAEVSCNHHGKLEEALEIVRAAKTAGADAIKLQTYTPDTMTIASDAPPFTIKGGLWSGRTLYDLYQEAYTPWEWHAPIAAECARVGLDFFSSPFDATAVDFLETLDVGIYKVASFELVDHPLLAKIAATGKPVIASTGMASLTEIEEAVGILRRPGVPLALLHCVSAYPAPPEEMNLRTIPHLAQTFGVPVGLSDHTPGIAASLAAVALGACVLERHLILDRKLGGPDAPFSIEPAELAQLVEGVRTVEKALGRVDYAMTSGERNSLVFRRSLFVVEDVKAGERFTTTNVRVIRPGSGLAPRELPRVLGRVAARPIARGTPLAWDLVGGP